MNIFIAVFSYGFPKLQELILKDFNANKISFARVLIGHVARVDQNLKVFIDDPYLYESDLVAWHSFDIILFLLRHQLQINVEPFPEEADKKELYFPLMSTLDCD